MIDFIIKNRANSTIEYSLLIVVFILALISMQAYLKRGMEGGWRRQVDQMAGQFSSAYENITMTVDENTTQIESQYRGVTNVTVYQNTTRLTNEKIEAQDNEVQIGI